MRGEEIAWYGWRGTESEVGFIDVRSYPNGDPLIEFPRDARVERVLLRPRSMLGFMGGLFFLDALSARQRSMPELILPFVPGSRQDRLNDEGDYLFTARSVANLVNSASASSVTILDPHSNVITGLLAACRVLRADECLPTITPGYYQAVVSPDAGAEKRAGLVAKKLGVPLLRAWKTRDVKTGAISGFGMEDVPAGLGYPVLVVDDICDGGGTFVGLADVLDQAGLKADLFVTHGLFTKGTQGLLSRYMRVICTDSTVYPRPDVQIVQVCNDLLTKGLT